MLVTMPRETVEAFWRALEKPDMGLRPDKAAEIGRAAAGTGWIAHLEIEAAILTLDARLGEIRVSRLLDAFGIRGQWVCSRPRPRGTFVLGVERIAAADAAHLLILLERLGFDVDPTPFCAPLLPALKARAYLTAAELAVFWHDRERHRAEPLEISAEIHPAWGKPDRTLRTAAGYRVEMLRGDDDRPSALRVTAPGRRRKRADLSEAA